MKYSKYDEGDRLSLLREALALVGYPEQNYPIIHVAGTNGKGSTSAMLAKLLRIQGNHVGIFSSPQVNHPLDGIQVQEKAISQKDYDRLMEHFRQINPDLSIFELEFLVATIYFAEKQVDQAIFEVGLGGELDATNVLSRVDLTVFTKIGLDHQSFLGDTIEEIAQTKAEIIRPNTPVILGAGQRSQVSLLIKKLAKDHQSPVIEAENYHTDTWNLSPAYQKENAKTALAFVDLMGWDMDVQTILENFKMPSRFEIVSNHPKIILDAAHNEDGIQAFVEAVRTQEESRLTIICGFLKDKSVDGMLKMLLTLDADFILTEPDHPERTLKVENLVKRFEELAPGRPYQTAPTGLKALSIAKADQPIYIVGSFFLLANIQDQLKKMP